MQPNTCDRCGKERATLYTQRIRLICYYCLPPESLWGVGALRAIRAAVTGVINIERQRRRLASQRCS